MSRTPTRSRKHRADTPATSSGALLILVGIVAFVLRVIAAIGVGRLPISRTPQYDALEYLLWAQHIAAGDFTWPVNPPHGPAYPFFLGALLAIGGGSLMFARVAQAFAGTGTCVLAAMSATRMFGRRAGLLTGALLAVYAPMIWLDGSIASEGLLLLLLAAAFWAAISGKHPAIIGLLAGLAALTRPTSLIFLPLLMTRGLSVRTGFSRSRPAEAGPHTEARHRRSIIIAATAIAVILPVTLANWHTSHAFLPVQAFGGMNIYLGDSPLRDGKASARPGAEWEKIEPEAARAGAKSEDSYFVSRTRSEIAAHPLAFASLLLRKALWTFQNDEVRDTHSFYFFQQEVPLLRFLPAFTFLLAFAVAGGVCANWRDRSVWTLAIFVALAAATCILLVVGARYRIPLALGLAMFGGIVAEQPRRKLFIAGAIALVAAACTRIERDAATHDFAEEWALTAASLVKEDRLAEAEDAAKKAIGIDGASALAWDKLGMANGAGARGAEAEQAFRRAVAINPDYATAHEHLGLALVQSGDVAGASAEYRRAVALDPRSVKALLGLARIEGALGRSSEGLAYAQRAAALRPPDDDGWLLIAMLAADARRFDVADDALTHVTDLERANAVRDAMRTHR